MLKRLSLDKGLKKKKEVAKVSLLNKKYSYFIGNIYAIFKRNLPNYPLVLSLFKHRNVWVFWNKKKIILLNYPLGLSLLKYRNVWVFWNKKKSSSNRCSPLNSMQYLKEIYQIIL